ncbi:tyrosine--tRNA ligase [Patescibacteria group bacterium]|nr:tyrosine--tRNA ligase [Patescibacteria group bacterium]MBU1034910.1 tyrosine--tRNA ligase [Patescibacteria group bacterium]MBU1629741.1 tyrosine--tRNA ligase [Patescibacteria group bacterium]MBU1907709.1 tyrosine--tRNA ligase [Patescibacteria group bacterium]
MTKKSKVLTDEKMVREFLSRAVENIYPSRDALEERLLSGKRMTVYLGVDPTGSSFHLGHAIALRKLGELQCMGHGVTLLIGDFTAMIGDPTDKMAVRKPLTRDEVMANCAEYKKQASAFLSFDGSNAAELKFNSAWLANLTFTELLPLAAHFTVQQMVQRDMFKRRIEEEKPIHLHEFLYPLMQGYDSVAMDIDMEIGGNDQTFNMLAGRTLMKEMKNKEKFVLATKLLVDPSGVKMGKTEGNMVTLGDDPNDMYGKVMSWTDGMIVSGFELCTNVPMDEVQEIASAIDDGENPIVFKHRLAEEVVRTFIGDAEAASAHEHFIKVHKEHVQPEEMPEFRPPSGKKKMPLVDALVLTKLVPSKTEARRQIEQGGVKADGLVVRDAKADVKTPVVLQKGKRHFAKII